METYFITGSYRDIGPEQGSELSVMTSRRLLQVAVDDPRGFLLCLEEMCSAGPHAGAPMLHTDGSKDFVVFVYLPAACVSACTQAPLQDKVIGGMRLS